MEDATVEIEKNAFTKRIVDARDALGAWLASMHITDALAVRLVASPSLAQLARTLAEKARHVGNAANAPHLCVFIAPRVSDTGPFALRERGLDDVRFADEHRQQAFLHELVKTCGRHVSYQIYEDTRADAVVGWIIVGMRFLEDVSVIEKIMNDFNYGRAVYRPGGETLVKLVSQLFEWDHRDFYESNACQTPRRKVCVFIVVEEGDDVIYAEQAVRLWERAYRPVYFSVDAHVSTIGPAAKHVKYGFFHGKEIKTSHRAAPRDAFDELLQRARYATLCGCDVVISSCRAYLTSAQYRSIVRDDAPNIFGFKDRALVHPSYPCAHAVYIPVSARADALATLERAICTRARCGYEDARRDLGHVLHDAFCRGEHRVEYHDVLLYPKQSTHPRNVCVYRVVTGNYEGNSLKNGAIQGCDTFVLTDEVSYADIACYAGIFPIILFPDGKSPKLTQRLAKALPHIHLPSNYTHSLYVDGHMQLLFAHINTYLESLDLSTTEIVCYLHPARQSVLAEASVVVSLKLESYENVLSVVSAIESDGVNPNTLTLTETNVLFRLHSSERMRAFGEEWAKCLHVCRRDQISFDYLVAKHNLHACKLPCALKPARKHRHVNPHARFVDSAPGSVG